MNRNVRSLFAAILLLVTSAVTPTAIAQTCDCAPNFCQAFWDTDCNNAVECSNAQSTTFTVPCTWTYFYKLTWENCNPATQTCVYCVKVINVQTNQVILNINNQSGGGTCAMTQPSGSIPLLCSQMASYRVEISLTDCNGEAGLDCDDCACDVKFVIKTDKPHATCN